MSSMFLMRLAFDLIAAGLLLLGLAYWWLGNTVHELVGHGHVFARHRAQCLQSALVRQDLQRETSGRGLFNIGITLLLLIAMLALLVTSVLISNTLSDFMSAYGGFTVRQIHTLAAYWVLVIVSIHLGLRWPMIMGVARNLFGISKSSAVRTLVLRASRRRHRDPWRLEFLRAGPRHQARHADHARLVELRGVGLRASSSTASRSQGSTWS